MLPMLLALVDRVTLAINLALIIGAVILAVVVLLLIVAGWTGINIVSWNRRRRQGEIEYRARRVRPDGTPYPPAGRGLCDGCQQVHDPVYHLPDGQRFCPECYAMFPKESP